MSLVGVNLNIIDCPGFCDTSSITGWLPIIITIFIVFIIFIIISLIYKFIPENYLPGGIE